MAFSGGVDSSLLLYYAALIHPKKTLALNINSILNGPSDTEDINKVIKNLKEKGLDFNFKIINFNPLENEIIKNNPKDRCYHCKSSLIKFWQTEAQKNNLTTIMEGSHKDDQTTYRPGRQALKENNILSPLAEAGFTKNEIRKLSSILNLYKPQRPSQACLASRVPYNQALSGELLSKIFKTEEILKTLGFAGARARVENNTLRIEFLPLHFEILNKNNNWQNLFTTLKEKLAPLNWGFITVDVQGYQGCCFDKEK